VLDENIRALGVGLKGRLKAGGSQPSVQPKGKKGYLSAHVFQTSTMKYKRGFPKTERGGGEKKNPPAKKGESEMG